MSSHKALSIYELRYKTNKCIDTEYNMLETAAMSMEKKMHLKLIYFVIFVAIYIDHHVETVSNNFRFIFIICKITITEFFFRK